jgi:MFS family permease
MRRHLEEPAVYAKAQRVHHGTVCSQIAAIFKPRYLATTIKASALATGATGGSYSFVVWLPTYLKNTRGLSVIGTAGYTVVLIAGSFVGFLLGAYLSDAIGRKRTFIISALGSVAMLALYMGVPLPDHAMLVLGFPLGVCAFMMFSPMGPYMTELFPTEIRGTGQGFCYNFGRGVGALFPGFIGVLSSVLPLAGTIAVFGITAYGIMLIALLLLPETAGRALNAVVAEAVEEGAVRTRGSLRGGGG